MPLTRLIPAFALLATLLPASAADAPPAAAEPATPLEVVRAFDAAAEAKDAAALERLWLRPEAQTEAQHRERTQLVAGRGDAYKQVRTEHVRGDAAVVAVIDTDDDAILVHVVRTAAGWRIAPRVWSCEGMGAESERLKPDFAELEKLRRKLWREIEDEREAALPPDKRAALAAERVEADGIARAVLAWVQGTGDESAVPIATMADVDWLLEHNAAAKAMIKPEELPKRREEMEAGRPQEIAKDLTEARKRFADAGVAMETLAFLRCELRQNERDGFPKRKINVWLKTPAGPIVNGFSIQAMLVDGKIRVEPGGVMVVQHVLEPDAP